MEEDAASIATRLEETTEKYLRLAAEFENFRKRQLREQQSFHQRAEARIFEALLPVLDDLERAEAQASKPDSTPEAINEGIRLIVQKFRRKLEEHGVKEVPISRGDVFDPELHEAIAEAPAPNPKLRGKILSIIEKGYRLEERILRYAKVQTASYE